jgi:cytochrome c2
VDGVAVHPLTRPAVRLFGLAGVSLAIGLAACDPGGLPSVEPQTGGNPERGRQLIAAYGCGACHTIPGVRRAQGLVGPRLVDLRRRSYLAGVLANTPENLVRWIEQPQAFSPRTAMPDVGASEAEARDMAAYLYMQ